MRNSLRTCLGGLAALGFNLFPLGGCTPPGGDLNAQPPEGWVYEECQNGKDDGAFNGLVDCADPACSVGFVWEGVSFPPDPACAAGDDDSVGDDDMAGDDDTPAPREGDDPGECRDGADNDQDGAFDCADSGCYGSPDCVEGDDDDDSTPAAGDYDGDGDPDALDCEDTNAAIHHGAIEVCDNADNDCDGVVDEEFDQDGDGFSVCQDDCSDNNAAMHPGANEVCNDLDDDCDSAVDDDCDGSVGDDDDDATPTGSDADGDGYTVSEGDCNNNNASVYPGATEVCDGAVDNDCDGTVDDGCTTPPFGSVTRTWCWVPQTTSGASYWRVGWESSSGWSFGANSSSGASCKSVTAPSGTITLNGWVYNSAGAEIAWGCSMNTPRGTWTRDGTAVSVTASSWGSGCNTIGQQ